MLFKQQVPAKLRRRVAPSARLKRYCAVDKLSSSMTMRRARPYRPDLPWVAGTRNRRLSASGAATQGVVYFMLRKARAPASRPGATWRPGELQCRSGSRDALSAAVPCTATATSWAITASACSAATPSTNSAAGRNVSRYRRPPPAPTPHRDERQGSGRPTPLSEAARPVSFPIQDCFEVSGLSSPHNDSPRDSRPDRLYRSFRVE